MNLLFYAPQMAAYGGMERHVCDLAGTLAGRGHHVVLLTTSSSLGPEMRAPLTRRGVVLRELNRRRGQAGSALKGLWLAGEVLRAEGTRWDLIYTNGQSGLARIPWFARRSHSRIVHHHHTAADAREQTTWSPAFRRVLRHAPEIVACSRATQSALAAAIGRDDIRFLPYLTPAPVAVGQVVDRVSTSAVPLNFGFLGRFVAEKGIDQICQLSLLPELADIAWHLHGAGPKYPPEFFRKFPRVTCHGPFAGPAQQAPILQRLDAVVLFSSHNEGMPLSLIEAMSAGLPWIASDRGGTRELAVSPPDSLVIDTLEIPALALAVREMADRIRAGRTSRTAQRQAYDARFAPDVVAAQWCEYFEAREAQLA